MEYLARQKDVEPIRIASMSRRISFFRDLVSLLRLVRILKREKPLVIHTHTAKAGMLGRLAGLLTRVPIRIHTFHGHVFHGYFSTLMTRILLIVERFLAAHSDRIVAISESQKRELVNTYRIAPAEKVVNIPIGFDLDQFTSIDHGEGSFRRSLACAPETKLIGWIGRLTAIKAPGLFIDCTELLNSEALDAHMVMVGDGELRRECVERIERKGLTRAVKMVGWRRDLASIYSDLDLVVLTSINEGTPLVLLEAMAAGRTFVATSVGGVRDLMAGDSRKLKGFEVFENGILASGDASSLAAGIRYLLERPELRRAMGQAGREFVTRRFSHHRLANDLESLYLSLAYSKSLLQPTVPITGPNSTSLVPVMHKAP